MEPNKVLIMLGLALYIYICILTRSECLSKSQLSSTSLISHPAKKKHPSASQYVTPNEVERQSHSPRRRRGGTTSSKEARRSPRSQISQAHHQCVPQVILSLPILERFGSISHGFEFERAIRMSLCDKK